VCSDSIHGLRAGGELSAGAVFCTCASPRGSALIARELCPAKSWTDDPVRRDDRARMTSRPVILGVKPNLSFSRQSRFCGIEA